jgi:hypothetical protein
MGLLGPLLGGNFSFTPNYFSNTFFKSKTIRIRRGKALFLVKINITVTIKKKNITIAKITKKTHPNRLSMITQTFLFNTLSPLIIIIKKKNSLLSPSPLSLSLSLSLSDAP